MARNSALSLLFNATLLSSGCSGPHAPDVASSPSTAIKEELGAAQDALPDRVTVACSLRGIKLSTRQMTAQESGVVLVVSSRMPSGTYLTYDSDGVGNTFTGGDPLPRHPAEWVLPLAPGIITLGCGLDGEDDPKRMARVRVTDSGGFWRGESLAKTGCGPGGSQPSWVNGLGGSGTSADDAVRHTPDAFEALARSQHRSVTYTARPAEIGYSGSATQTWVALRTAGHG